MPAEPFDDLRVLMGGVVVEDYMDDLADRDLGLDLIEKADELLMPVLLHALPDDRTVEHVERREERGRSVALIVMGHRPAAPLLQRQARLGPVQRLDLGFLIKGQHHRMGRWIDIEPDHITKLLGKMLVIRQLELAYPMRLSKRGSHEGGHNFGAERRNARRPGLVAQEAVHALLHEPLLPSPDAGLRYPRLTHDLGRGETGWRPKHDPRAPDMLLRTVSVRSNRLQTSTIGGIQFNEDRCAHQTDSHSHDPRGIPYPTLPSDFIH